LTLGTLVLSLNYTIKITHKMKTQMKNTETTQSQLEWFEMWKEIVKNQRVGNNCYTEWDENLQVVRITTPNPNNNYAIEISYVDFNNKLPFSIDLIDLDYSNPLEDDGWFNYYVEGLEWDNTTISTLASINYLYELLPKLN